MSQENVEIARRGYEAFNRGDIPAVFEIFDQDIEWQLPEGGLNTGLLKGRREVRELFEGYFQVFEVFRVEPEEFFDTADKVVAFVRTIGRGRGSGVDVDFPFAQLWTIREGKPVRCESFPDRKRALEAAGLSE